MIRNRNRYADRLAASAAELVVMVRDQDPEDVGRHLHNLSRQRLEHLVIALAAMCPDDRSVRDLLAWTANRPAPVVPVPEVETRQQRANRLKRERRKALREANDPRYVQWRKAATEYERERVRRLREAA